MKKSAALAIAVIFSMHSIPVHAFLDFDNSVRVNYYSQYNLYLDLGNVVAAIDRAAAKIELQTFQRQKADLARQYNLKRIGSSIGVDLSGSAAGELVEQIGLNKFQKLIENRIQDLKVNSALAANIIFSISGKELVKKEDLLDSKTGRNFVKEASELGNFQAVFELVDFVKKNPGYENAERVLEAFDSRKVNSRSRFAEVDRNEKIILKQTKTLNDDLRLAIVESVRSTSFDFNGVDFSNIDSQSSRHVVAENARALADQLTSTLTQSKKLKCDDAVMEARIEESHKFFERARQTYTFDRYRNYHIQATRLAGNKGSTSSRVTQFIEDGVGLQNCRPTEKDLEPKEDHEVFWLISHSESCKDVLTAVEQRYKCTRIERTYGALEKMLRKKGGGDKSTVKSIAVR